MTWPPPTPLPPLPPRRHPIINHPQHLVVLIGDRVVYSGMVLFVLDPDGARVNQYPFEFTLDKTCEGPARMIYRNITGPFDITHTDRWAPPGVFRKGTRIVVSPGTIRVKSEDPEWVKR